jgi:hypothetical protein
VPNMETEYGRAMLAAALTVAVDDVMDTFLAAQWQPLHAKVACATASEGWFSQYGLVRIADIRNTDSHVFWERQVLDDYGKWPPEYRSLGAAEYPKERQPHQQPL